MYCKTIKENIKCKIQDKLYIFEYKDQSYILKRIFQNIKFTMQNKFNIRCLTVVFISFVSTLSGVLFSNICF